MISHLGVSLAAVAMTLGVVLHPAASHAAALVPAAQMAHLSVVATGKGASVILNPGLSSPRAVWDNVGPALARTQAGQG